MTASGYTISYDRSAIINIKLPSTVTNLKTALDRAYEELGPKCEVVAASFLAGMLSLTVKAVK